MINFFNYSADTHQVSNTCTVRFSGDSMMPKYKTGDILNIFQILNHEVILWGESYLIQLGHEANNLCLVRNIFPHPELSKIILRSTNRDNYSDIVIDKADMLYLFIIKGKLEINHL